MDVPESWPAWAGGILAFFGGGTGLWGWAAAREARKPAEKSADGDLLAAQAAYQVALNGQAKVFTDAVEALVAGLRHQVAELEDTVENLKAEAANCRREGEELKGENRQLRQIVSIMARKMREHGIDLPEELSVVGLFEVETGGLTVVSAVKGRRK